MLRAKLYEREVEKKQAEVGASRKSQVRSGDRSEKIRTYNYPQSRVTDHRIGYTQHNLPAVMNGEVEEFINQLKIAETAEKMANNTNWLVDSLIRWCADVLIWFDYRVTALSNQRINKSIFLWLFNLLV